MFVGSLPDASDCDDLQSICASPLFASVSIRLVHGVRLQLGVAARERSIVCGRLYPLSVSVASTDSAAARSRAAVAYERQPGSHLEPPGPLLLGGQFA